MALLFPGVSLPGTNGPLIQTAPTLQTKRTKFFGVLGESEIIGYGGGRYLECTHWLYGGWTTPDQIKAALLAIDSAVGLHGTLTISGSVSRPYENCTFEGFTFSHLGILVCRDGGLGDGANPSFWVEGTVRWYQLFAGITSPSAGTGA